ncbi:2-pyrone-4,6-dicarboxylate hydrolase [Roseivivax halodurans JCM 10272]|uniref:2-pyrone-4,6-dicarboxylate hydrolase n=1 Tax=Roseivivax halodurans JCM 10272 TaxID=1449350 RepID=X7EBZ1_9RHOB|nr:amidohydrolase family protein [Roseivivax halodurans]ETX13370.1 2-pyrone-4,6-dicarboxylate hydrolase [Roseivivax halodurans JCM 10272]
MAERELTWHQSPHTTTVALPRGAADCHCHVFGPAAVFPFAPESKFKPADAPCEALFALHDQMGIDRCVIVQSGCHGFDNRVVADAMARRPGRYLGIALAPPDVREATIRDLDAQGFRGVRFNYMSHLAPGASPDELRALAPRLAAQGWHLQVHMEDALIAELAPVLAALPVTVVIDHIGRIDASRGRDQPEFEALMRLLEHDHVWCKVSGSERASRQDAPYADATPFAREIVETYPDRVVWGTDWPHPNFRSDPPDDGDLFDLLPQIAPTDALLAALLVDNPPKLYGFKEIA